MKIVIGPNPESITKGHNIELINSKHFKYLGI